ncbi:MAG: gfo/Idh/MocA family oxidoreductase [Planctomycetota bacterium]|nr:MAG: gfo/Idh/MocA family oxidoreductase [Planctomycetota bacterium]
MISLALIGCGDVAETGHVPTILGHDAFRLAAVCDVDRRRAELFSALAGGAPAYADWRELLASERQLDGLVLALPPEASPEIVVEALRRKLAVLDEKPLAASLSEGLHLQRAVEEYDGVYQIGFVLRYGDWVDRIRREVAALGQPLQISVAVYDERLNSHDPAHSARIQSFIKNSSAMAHEGSHVIDYVGLWNDSPWTAASAVTQQTSPAFPGPNIWNARIDFENRSTLSVKIGWLLPELPHSTVTIVGPDGRLDFDCVTGIGHVETGAVERSFSAPPLAPQWQRQYQEFAAAVRRGRARTATVYDGLRALETTAACELSAKTGATVTPDDLAAAWGLPPAAEVRAATSGPVAARTRVET